MPSGDFEGPRAHGMRSLLRSLLICWDGTTIGSKMIPSTMSPGWFVANADAPISTRAIGHKRVVIQDLNRPWNPGVEEADKGHNRVGMSHGSRIIGPFCCQRDHYSELGCSSLDSVKSVS